MNPLKQVIGIDCGQKELVCRFGELTPDLESTLKARKTCPNTATGIETLIRWADGLAGGSVAPVFVVEATGIYHQKLAYELYHQGRPIVVVLPSRASHFAKTLKVRTITDSSSAEALMQMGLEKNLDLWQPPHPIFATLKQLTRERKRLKDEMNRLKNQRHADEGSVEALPETLGRINQRLQLAEEHIVAIEKQIQTLIAENEELRQKFSCVCSIKGVGLMTAATVVGEADGFSMARNARQLVSYAGYDIVEKQSGTSVKGKARISKKGNTYIRRALYFPAITAARHDQHLGRFYERLHEKHNIKMKAYTAVQRKLLVLIYTLWTKQEPYDSNYQHKKVEQPEPAAPHELA
ncbi:IS110 family transposase [Fodinibius sediminis]|uniref:Transposase n=1 Tax=Fodinibius sediminis TaxID=1214077 RepID=A0A521FJN3_9BACT|nr:IS110 family transposase [Fodinibius sediminis]SMO96234.1 Transposase [Fodinibius sediminis]